jgi:hypothetical protein
MYNHKTSQLISTLILGFILTASAAVFSSVAHAQMSPSPTEKTCPKGEKLDPKTKKCVASKPTTTHTKPATMSSPKPTTTPTTVK